MNIQPYKEKRLVKSRDKWIFGTIGGFADYFAVDKVAARVIYLIGLSVGPFQFELFVAYILLTAIISDAENYDNY